MGGRPPLEIVTVLLEAMNEGDVERSFSLHEPEAAPVVEPGKMAIGVETIARRAPPLRPLVSPSRLTVPDWGSLHNDC